MNKTININLGGYPFTMDDSAYDLIDRYLNSINKHFMHSESFQEIITDIELRLGELLNEKIEGRKIVNIQDVNFAIQIMGRPEEFGAESIDIDTSPTQEQPRNSKGNEYRTGKKLFRNPNDKYLGGVSSGLAAYFGIENANWVRLAFILLASSGGIGVPLYIIMWIFIPEAKTSADFLAMKGEKITVNNIAEYVEKEINQISNKFSDFAEDLKGKTSQYSKKGFRQHSIDIDLEKKIKKGAGYLSSILKPVLTFFGVALILVFCILWISLIVGVIMATPFFQYLSSSSWVVNFISSLNMFVVFGVPLILLIFSGLKLVFGTSISKSLKQGLSIFWVSNFICLLVLSSTTFREFSNRVPVESRQNIEGLTSEKVHLTSKSITHDDIRLEIGSLRLGYDAKLHVDGSINLNIKPSDDGSWYLVKKVFAGGMTVPKANENAKCIIYDVTVSDNHTLNIPSDFAILEGCKYRFQTVELTLHIPEGQTITMDNNLQWRINNVLYDKNQMKDGWRFLEGKTYKMTNIGLQCVDCSAEELIATTSSKEYWDYVSNEEIPVDYTLQTIEDLSRITVPVGEEVRLDFDKIMAGSSALMQFKKIELNINQSPDSTIAIKRVVKYYSKEPVTTDIAKLYAFRHNGSNLTFSNVGYIPASFKPINPKVIVTVSLPVDTKIRIDENVNDFDAEIMYDRDEIKGGWRFMNNELLEMGVKGLKCINCN